MKAQEFLDKEKEKYGKIYSDISFAIDNISPFLDTRELKTRKYSSFLPVLKKYIDKIEVAESNLNKSGIFSIFSNGKIIDELEKFKFEYKEELRQLEKCVNCKCLNCSIGCKFDGCLGCREGSNVVSCDHEKINVRFHDNFYQELLNEKSGKREKYKVLATLMDAKQNRHYIIIEGVFSKDKYVLYYYPDIDEDRFGEIKDEQEFDYIVETYQSVER
ncbi:hypothetical protein ABG79_00993 [Caloramator mitchellensis]|uniref:DUF1292 domain-containing protein n=1 Tax=Caloramator mitchellensis TaxID=908809 RepID=A0A0R3JUG5_CALMK|nr:hypothetical protein [Caloramator mitchellensis]KRQ87195.1 hypothetical protein ABG79_00993 [Caloramator mitchellensis]